MTDLNPYITFDGNAREAMEYYRSVFGGELAIDTFGQYPMPGMSDDDLEKVMHAQLNTPGGMILMGADSPPGAPFDSGSRITVSLSGTDDDELRGYWDRLADGGVVQMPLETSPWGAAFGGLIDRYGVSWFVNIGAGSPS